MIVKVGMIVIINIDIRVKLVIIIPLGVIVILNTPVEVIEITQEIDIINWLKIKRIITIYEKIIKVNIKIKIVEEEKEKEKVKVEIEEKEKMRMLNFDYVDVRRRLIIKMKMTKKIG